MAFTKASTSSPTKSVSVAHGDSDARSARRSTQRAQIEHDAGERIPGERALWRRRPPRPGAPDCRDARSTRPAARSWRGTITAACGEVASAMNSRWRRARRRSRKGCPSRGRRCSTGSAAAAKRKKDRRGRRAGAQEQKRGGNAGEQADTRSDGFLCRLSLSCSHEQLEARRRPPRPTRDLVVPDPRPSREANRGGRSRLGRMLYFST